jgi:hypothetical protein
MHSTTICNTNYTVRHLMRLLMRLSRNRCSPCGSLRCCSVTSCLLLWWWFWKKSSAWIFKQSIGARKRLGIGLSYPPARQHSLVELVPWNRFLGSLKVWKFGLRFFSSNVNCCLLRGGRGGGRGYKVHFLLSQEIIVTGRTRVAQHFTIGHKKKPREVYFTCRVVNCRGGNSVDTGMVS